MKAAGLHETERHFQQSIVQLAKVYHWRVYHSWLSVRSSPGFPDLTLVKAGQPVLFVEVKSQTGQLTRSQRDWLEALSQAKGAEVYVWRPSDYETIMARLHQGG